MSERRREKATLPRFGLVRAGEDLELHAVALGTDDGAALCGAEPPETGWIRGDQTTWLYVIDCHACRERAAAARASAFRERVEPSGEAGNG